jgi:outer membrane protein assembly factor BamB
VRLAPVVAEGRVYAASDDGFLYCLAARPDESENGPSSPVLYWSRRGGPADALVLGNDHIISRWPIRGGPVVRDGTVYFGAGIWPSEGIFIRALDAITGEEKWHNSGSGSLYMAQPHPGAYSASGISSRGYLVADSARLLVPTGRSVPAVFDRTNGELLYFHLGERVNVKTGGTGILAGDGHFLNGGALFDSLSGRRQGGIPRGIAPELAAETDLNIVWWDSGRVHSGHWETTQSHNRKGQSLQKLSLKEDASFAAPYGGSALIRAAGDVISAGVETDGDGYGVCVLDAATGKVRFSAPVQGNPLGLAATDKRLVVSTDLGAIHCFGGTGGKTPKQADITPSPSSLPDPEGEAVVDELLKAGIPTAGWCIDLQCGTGVLACALARRTDLQICAVDSDQSNVEAARKRLREAGFLNSRASVFHVTEDATQLPPHFANLVVSGRSLSQGAQIVNKETVARLQQPFSGQAWFGRGGTLTSFPAPALSGTGEWTHQYADPGNTNCSGETRVHGPLGALWFKDFGFTMPSRHGRGPAPLFVRGRMIVEGRDALRCIDAYNGRVLWDYPLPGILAANDQDHIMGVSGTGSNICADASSVYVRRAHDCLCLDLLTGKLRRTIPAPSSTRDGKPGTWGYLAIVGDTLFGTLADTSHIVEFRYLRGDMRTQFTEAVLLFAVDADTGRLKWSYAPAHSIRHNSIAIGNGRIHFIDRAQAAFDRLDPAYTGNKGRRDTRPFPNGTLLALNSATGQELWRHTDAIWGTLLALSSEHDVLVMAYQDTAFKLRSELGGKMAAFDASNGTRLWEIEAAYKSRPVLSGRKIYAQPGAWNLLTGEKRPFTFSRAYGCGTISACATMLLFRSGTLGFVDLTGEYGTENYGGVRPGCWINAIPAGGMVLMPDATDRCTCSYLTKSSLALIPYGMRAPKLIPASASAATPQTVAMEGERDTDEIRYTLDGSDPTPSSNLYRDPVPVSRTSTITARAFRPGVPPSPSTTGEFVIDPAILDIDGEKWVLYDAPGKSGHSAWSVADDTVTETSNYYIGDAKNRSPHTERPGTCRIYSPGSNWTDGELRLEISSRDNDGVGIVFRWQSPDRYLLWAMDAERRFHILARKDGDTYEILDVAEAGYELNTWYRITIVLDDDAVAVSINGKPDLQAEKVMLRKGTFGFYSWGSTGAQFRGPAWYPEETR